MNSMSDGQSTILVLEDEELLLTAVTRKLELAGKRVIACASGKQALDTLTESETVPDLIWLDYYLKDMNGLEFMQKMKENPKWENIPVLVVSNSASPDKVTKMMGMGVKKYVLKAAHRLDELVEMTNEISAGKEVHEKNSDN
ncbi:TPA: hypothetical protein DCZ90_01890 [Candidatus Amesbacteria bacterium]|nr:hypothetical protein [Candidatus Amesbacteria bacterium]